MRKLFALVLIATLPSFASAAGDCTPMAKTDLEKVYCQIAATPEGQLLPSFADFRSNSPKVQALLLKQPARKLGLDLPKLAAASAPKPPSRNSKPRSKTPAPQTSTPTPTQSTVPSQPPVVTTPPDPLANCRLQNEIIHCPQSQYQFSRNRQNQFLPQDALTSANVMALDSFQGNLQDKSAVNRYLARSYRHYIDKMLFIGLGASTMTYTKFHYTFWDLVEKREDFAGRVNAMYNFLKQDKATMAVQERYDKVMPAGIDWCTSLSDSVVVCDDGKRNWVYTRQAQ